MVFENEVKNIQAVAYNGARTVVYWLFWQSKMHCTLSETNKSAGQNKRSGGRISF
jgi:hypothetical protein